MDGDARPTPHANRPGRPPRVVLPVDLLRRAERRRERRLGLGGNRSPQPRGARGLAKHSEHPVSAVRRRVRGGGGGSGEPPLSGAPRLPTSFSARRDAATCARGGAPSRRRMVFIIELTFYCI